MELFTPAFWSSLLSIIIIDLVLAGDNAIVIGMAARKLPQHLQFRAILWGTAGAIVIRIIATLLVVWLLKIKGLMFVGGLLLIWIAAKLLAPKKQQTNIKAQQSIVGAITTIMVADAVMGLDNVIAVAGAAAGNITLVIIGLLLSIPIMIWGSTLIIKWIERHPVIIYLGAGVLAYTAGKMITSEASIAPYFTAHPTTRWLVIIAITAAVIIYGMMRNNNKQFV